ncbi:MAG TPA: class I SAM-dependent methyltransferase [Gaiellaceae bacterium]|nr:class I SAM-dependent methyltransferase [Gaiellaceae bacterium]
MAFEELKQKQGAIWGSGPYQNVTDTISDLHEIVLEQIAPSGGERWLDLACGTGAVAERAARAGADVTGVDLAPALIETAEERARDQGLEIDYRVGDCERLDGLEDGAYDIVSSTCGIMFAPDHAATAKELGRVTTSGGRLILVNWEPEGGLGKMFAMMKSFQPPPPEGAGVPFDWGREEHVQTLLGDDFELHFDHGSSTYSPASGEEYWQVFSTSYGPTKALADSLEENRREEFHRTWVDFFENTYGENGGIAHVREYLLVQGTRR